MTLVLPQCPIAWPLLNVVAASDSPYTRAPRPSEPVIAPGRSNLPRTRSDSPMTRGASSTRIRPIGTFTKNTQRQSR